MSSIFFGYDNRFHYWYCPWCWSCNCINCYAVPVDEKAEAINEVLPGANCGACGFSGCAGYADALSKAKLPTPHCAPVETMW